MSNYIFIPDDNSLVTSEGLRKGTIYYKINTSPYQTIFWTVRQTLLYKMKISSSNIIIDENILSSDEKTEYKMLFNNVNKVPKENIIKKCIIVFINQEMAIGLKAIGKNKRKNIYLAFKSSKLNEIKEICKRNNVTINYDNRLVLYLFDNGYINEIAPYGMFMYIAEKFKKIEQEDKIFANKCKLAFGKI
jgi:type III secretion system FlhB-like substrate exporter